MHQALLADIETKIKSMGLVIKPKKCRSLSIQGGKTVNIEFTLKDEVLDENIIIASVIDKPLKFLGSDVCGTNSPSAMFASIFEKLKTKLENINKSTLRGEFKTQIYSRYALPSMRFYFSVHQLHKSHEDKLDALARSHLKVWLGIQKHGVTDTAIFHPYMLNIKAPSQVYNEAHAGSHAIIRSKGDEVVNHALNSRIERESAWTRKHSTAVTMHEMWKDNIEQNRIKPTHEEDTYASKKQHVQNAKKVMQSSVKSQTINTWNTRVQKLTFQGDFLKLLIDEKENVTWQSISNNIPKGVLSFALKACSNGLNTPDNLKGWGIRKTDKCDLCKCRSSLEHILNWCPVALNEGRFTWRHNSVLNHFAITIKKIATPNLEILADLPSLWLNGGTIPPDILSTSFRPDLVILNRSEKKIELLELTCSFEKNIDMANLRKAKKYNDLKMDLEGVGWTVQLIPFEVGSRGQITKRNKEALINVLKRNQIKLKNSQLFKDMSKISLLCSYSIFQAHCVLMWRDPPYLHP